MTCLRLQSIGRIERSSNIHAGKSLTLRGLIQTEFAADQQDDFLREAGGWLADGRLNHRDHVVRGLENAPGALIAQLQGGNFGKMLVQVSGKTG